MSLGLAWLEKSKRGFITARRSLPAEKLFDKLKDTIWGSDKSFEFKTVKNDLSLEIERIDKAAEMLDVHLDDNVDPSLQRPLLKEFIDELDLPTLNTKPLPLK